MLRHYSSVSCICICMYVFTRHMLFFLHSSNAVAFSSYVDAINDHEFVYTLCFLSLSAVETVPGGGDFVSSLFGDCLALALPSSPALPSPSAGERNNNTNQLIITSQTAPLSFFLLFSTSIIHCLPHSLYLYTLHYTLLYPMTQNYINVIDKLLSLCILFLPHR